MHLWTRDGMKPLKCICKDWIPALHSPDTMIYLFGHSYSEFKSHVKSSGNKVVSFERSHKIWNQCMERFFYYVLHVFSFSINSCTSSCTDDHTIIFGCIHSIALCIHKGEKHYWHLEKCWIEWGMKNMAENERVWVSKMRRLIISHSFCTHSLTVILCLQPACVFDHSSWCIIVQQNFFNIWASDISTQTDLSTELLYIGVHLICCFSRTEDVPSVL